MIRRDLKLIQRVRLTLHAAGSVEEEAINGDLPLAEVIAAFSDSSYNLMNFNRGLVIIIKKSLIVLQSPLSLT